MNAFRPYAEHHYREELCGLRGCAAILIVVYQIWFNKESGGIDAIFVLSGFLMSSVLLRQYAQQESLRPFHFWADIIKRVAPPSYLVLLATFLLGTQMLPAAQWRVVHDDLLLSAVHLENLQLMRNGTIPLQYAMPNPFEHFWAVSMHMQFYLLLPLLMGPVLFLGRVFRSRQPIILWALMIILASGAYSVSATHGHPASAYFHTAARLWEFFIGVLLALLAPLFQLGQLTARVLAMVGMTLLLGTGIFISPQAPFPGIAALVPVMATALLIIAGGRPQTSVRRFLCNQHLAYLGNASLAIYLWHWPVLVFAQQYHGTTSLGLAQGMLVIVAVMALAILTMEIVESPFRRIPKSNPWRAYIVGIVFFTPVFAAWVGSKHHVLTVERAEQVSRHSVQEWPQPNPSESAPQRSARPELSGRIYLDRGMTDRAP